MPGLCLPGIGVRHERLFTDDLDSFPLPDISLLCPSAQKDEEPWIPVQTRRGCPMKCSYCSTPDIEGAVMRQRSVDVVVDWIGHWVDEGFDRFFFVDNVFNLPLRYAKELCRKLIDCDLGIQWQAIVYPKWVDEGLVDLMAKAGCSQAGLGFESGSASILKSLGKAFTVDEVRRVSGLFAEHGIQRMGFLLLGGPGETKATVAKSFEVADSLNLDLLKITVGIRIYPNTPLAAQAVDDGVISPRNELLDPCFYMAKGLEDWLPQIAAEWGSSRPYTVV